jgi:hypothetical protein
MLQSYQKPTCTRSHIKDWLLLMCLAAAADQGKNCSQWLLELQQLHMQKKELSTGHAHMA